MTLPVHLVPDLSGVTKGDSVRVEGDEAHHAVAVRRLRVGEGVVLTDGLGASVVATVTETGKRVFVAEVEERRDDPEPSPRVTVVQALPKGERGELAVEMLTEIGVGRIVPWAASRSVAVWRGERVAKGVAKWRSTAREAAKQARRGWFPVVDDLATTADVAALLRDRVAVVLHEEATTGLAALDGLADEVVVVVGPEGGLAPEEVAAFEASGAVTVRLGAEVLRTSTAGVAAVAALLAGTPRWG
jgi:16S rRNA (uracil1498-N3)-methyltransferase